MLNIWIIGLYKFKWNIEILKISNNLYKLEFSKHNIRN